MSEECYKIHSDFIKDKIYLLNKNELLFFHKICTEMKHDNSIVIDYDKMRLQLPIEKIGTLKRYIKHFMEIDLILYDLFPSYLIFINPHFVYKSNVNYRKNKHKWNELKEEKEKLNKYLKRTYESYDNFGGFNLFLKSIGYKNDTGTD